MKNLQKTVLDTNILISSWKGSINSPNTEIITLWQAGKITLLYSDDILSEYIEKLSEKGMSKEKLRILIKNIYNQGVNVNIKHFHLITYPEDQDDIAFVLCAENGKADYLVSYDSDLLDLNGCYFFKICNSLDFLFEYRSF